MGSFAWDGIRVRRVIACVANLALSDAQSTKLEKRGAIVLPDYLVNGGAVLAEYALLRGLCEGTLAGVESVVRERIGGAVREVMRRRAKRSVRQESGAMFGFRTPRTPA